MGGDWFAENMRRIKEGEKRRKLICLRGALREGGPGFWSHHQVQGGGT